jgi:hypothetical protein
MIVELSEWKFLCHPACQPGIVPNTLVANCEDSTVNLYNARTNSLT